MTSGEESGKLGGPDALRLAKTVRQRLTNTDGDATLAQRQSVHAMSGSKATRKPPALEATQRRCCGHWRTLEVPSCIRQADRQRIARSPGGAANRRLVCVLACAGIIEALCSIDDGASGHKCQHQQASEKVLTLITIRAASSTHFSLCSNRPPIRVYFWSTCDVAHQLV